MRRWNQERPVSHDPRWLLWFGIAVAVRSVCWTVDGLGLSLPGRPEGESESPPLVQVQVVAVVVARVGVVIQCNASMPRHNRV